MALFKAKQLPKPLVIRALIAFAAISPLGIPFGQTAPGSPIVSDVPVAGGTERVLFLGAPGARALLVLLAGGDGLISLDSRGGIHRLGSNFSCGRSVNGLRKDLPWFCRTRPTEPL